MTVTKSNPALICYSVGSMPKTEQEMADERGGIIAFRASAETHHAD
jgi:hypothetical protein